MELLLLVAGGFLVLGLVFLVAFIVGGVLLGLFIGFAVATLSVLTELIRWLLRSTRHETASPERGGC